MLVNFFDTELFQTNGLYEIIDEAMVINPAELLKHISRSVDDYIKETESDEYSLQKFRCTLINFFSDDMEHIKK